MVERGPRLLLNRVVLRLHWSYAYVHVGDFFFFFVPGGGDHTDIRTYMQTCIRVYLCACGGLVG